MLYLVIRAHAMSSLDLSIADEIWVAFGWLFTIWFIFEFPTRQIRTSAIRQITEVYSTNIGNIWLASLFHRFTGLSIGLFYAIGWGIIYLCLTISAYFTWIAGGWEDQWVILTLFTISIVSAALWFPVFYGFWPYSAVWSLGFIGGGFGAGLPACILMFLGDYNYHWVAGAFMIPYLSWLVVAFVTVFFQPYVANGLYPCIPFHVPQMRGSYDWDEKSVRDLDALEAVPRVENPWKIKLLNELPARDFLLSGTQYIRVPTDDTSKTLYDD